MIWIVVAIVLGVAAFVTAVAALITLIDATDGREIGLVIGLGLVVSVGLTVGCVKSAIAAGRDYGSRSCESFGEQTGYEVRYLVTTVFDSGECFVRFNGNWVPRGQLWAEMGGRS